MGRILWKRGGGKQYIHIFTYKGTGYLWNDAEENGNGGSRGEWETGWLGNRHRKEVSLETIYLENF